MTFERRTRAHLIRRVVANEALALVVVVGRARAPAARARAAELVAAERDEVERRVGRRRRREHGPRRRRIVARLSDETRTRAVGTEGEEDAS